ncbi:MAG: hypothetical protein IT353_04145 [Gemmatimonadaceae bacterium]|nr:hypothetical protein [Gemmatimonadaceae bacterium]
MRSLFSLRPYHTRAAVLGLSAVAVASCTKLTESDLTANKFGAVNILAKHTGGTSARASGTVILFEAFSAALPNSLIQQSDQCVFSQVDTSTAAIRGVNQAGEAVTFSVGGRAVTLPYESSNQRYATPPATPFTYAAGEQVQATIPGNPSTFPASSITVRLAEPIFPGPVAIPTGTTPMTFTWNAAPDTTSAIVLSLRYANPAQSSYANEQIFCALRDDGTHQLPSSALTAFLASPNDKRLLQLTRWRTSQVSVDSRSFLHVTTSIDTTITFQP